MTSEENQALIERIKKYKIDMTWSSDGIIALSERDIKKCIEIALDALTAQPVKCPSFDDYKPHVAEELRAAFIAAIRAAGYEVQE